MHNGDDTANYVSLGYRVVAIDANPAMVAAAEVRFEDAIGAGKVTILNCGIHPDAVPRTFYVSDHDDWSSFEETHATMEGESANAITVQTRRFEDVLAEHGVPHYLKVDIEVLDDVCLKALTSVPAPDRPRYVSWEAGVRTLADLQLMIELGYDRFKSIRQTDFRAALREEIHPGWARVRRGIRRGLGRGTTGGPQGFPVGSSGPFGEAADGPWHSGARTLADWRAYLSIPRGPVGVWYDLHARLGTADAGPIDLPA